MPARFRSLVFAVILGGGLLHGVSGVTADPATTNFGYSTLIQGEGRVCTLVKIDLETGGVIEYPGLLPDERACVDDLAVAPDGTPWGVVSLLDLPTVERVAAPAEAPFVAYLVRFDPVTGEVASATVLADEFGSRLSLFYGGIAVNTTGVYVHALGPECSPNDEVCLFTVDPSTGIATQVGNSGIEDTQFYYLADCGALLSATSGEDGGRAFYDISAATGAASNPRSTGALYGYDCEGGRSYALESPRTPTPVAMPQATTLDLVTFDPASGATTLVAAVTPELANLNAFALPPTPQQPTTTTTTTSGGDNTGNNAANTGTGAVNTQPRFTG